MKLFHAVTICNTWKSRPARGGWIEMVKKGEKAMFKKSRPARGGWIEMTPYDLEPYREMSRPARGGWIEILYSHSGS